MDFEGPSQTTQGLPAAERIQAAAAAFRAACLPQAAAHLQGLESLADPAQRAEAATLLSRITRRQGKLDLALVASGRAVEAARAAGLAGLECRARVQQAHALSAIGLVDAALEESYRALHLSRQSGASAEEAAALEALAGVQWTMSNWDDCLASFRRMLELATAAGDLELQMVAHGGLGGAERQRADSLEPEARLASLQRAQDSDLAYLRLATRMGDVFGMRSARHNHAVGLTALGQADSARATLESLQEELTDDSSRAPALMNLAEIDLQEGQAARALARLEQAHALLAPMEDAAYLANCCQALSRAHQALGQWEPALLWYQRYHTHYVRMASERTQVHARALAVRYETSQAQAQAIFERERAERLEQDALQDELTRLANRRAFDQALESATAAGRQGRSFGLALLDIDNFKQVNDTLSHLAGDEVLRRVGRILATNTRQGDLAARYGGEEFALVLHGVQQPAVVAQACERARRAIEQEDWGSLAPGLEIRISVGCLHVGPALAPTGPAALLARVDRRLYAAKAGGRNRVVSDDLE